MTTESAGYCMLVNEWAWSRSQVYLLRLVVDLGSVLESELGQKWRYGALKASPIPCCPDKRGVSVIVKGKKTWLLSIISLC